MKAADTHEIEVTLHLRVPKSTPERQIQRLRMALVSVAADMDDVIEAGIDDVAGQPTRAQLLHLWHTASDAAPIVMGMAPADSVWGGMTCIEAEAIAGVWGAAGYPNVAEFIIEQHALGDDECDDMHHDKDACPHDHEEEPHE